jgi:hypothetical protein
MAEHPIATYELDEEQLLAATITEIAEARVHLGDAEQILIHIGKASSPDNAAETALRVMRAAACVRVARARVDADELPLFVTHPTADVLQRCAAACDVALAHVQLLEAVMSDQGAMPQVLSHAKKAVDAARGEVHKTLAAILVAAKA